MQPVHIICREGRPEDLVADLARHSLDMVLTSDNPPAEAFPLAVDTDPGPGQTSYRQLVAGLVGRGSATLDSFTRRTPCKQW